MNNISRPFHSAIFSSPNINIFDQALNSQNIPLNTASRSPVSPLPHYAAKPIDQATAGDAYVLSGKHTAYNAARVQVNPKLPELAQHPAVVLKNQLDGFIANLSEGKGYKPLKQAALNYSRTVDTLLSIRPKTEEKVHYNPAEMGKDAVERTKLRLAGVYNAVSTALHAQPSYNWNRIEGKNISALRKGPPSLFTLAAVQAARLKADKEDLSAWESHPLYSTVLDKGLENVTGLKGQIQSLIDYMNSSVFSPYQRLELVSEINSRLYTFTNEFSAFSLEELRTSPDRLVEAMEQHNVTVPDLIGFLRQKPALDVPLMHFTYAPSFENIRETGTVADYAHTLKSFLELIPAHKKDTVIDDLARHIEPFKQRFKQANPDY